MAEKILQRIVMPPRRGLTPLYCRFIGPRSRLRGGDRQTIVLPRGSRLKTDTWFNAFFERHWREYTDLSELVLQLQFSGTGTLRLYYCSSEKDRRLLHEIDFSGEDRRLCVKVDALPASSDSCGLLFCEIEARSSHLVVHQAEWLA